MVQHTERVREAMSDKRLWHGKSSSKPEKLFEMKEKIGYIGQGGKIKGKKRKLGRARMTQVGLQMPKAGVKSTTS